MRRGALGIKNPCRSYASRGGVSTRATWTPTHTRRGCHGFGILTATGGISSSRAWHRLLGLSVGWPPGKPQPAMHATSILLKDHVLLVRLGPVMPEDHASDGFDAGRLPQEGPHLVLGHPKSEAWPVLRGRVLVHRSQAMGRLPRPVRAAGCTVAALACPAHAWGRAGFRRLGGGPAPRRRADAPVMARLITPTRVRHRGRRPDPL
jgi:hypothetical protein